MNFVWSVRPNSRISRIPFPPLRWLALLLRNLYVVLLMIRPKSEYIQFTQRQYEEAVILSLQYINYARVAGDVGEFGSHGLLAPTIAKYLGREDKDRIYHVFDSFEGYPEAITEIDASSPHFQDDIWRPKASPSPMSARKMLKTIRKHHAKSCVHEGYFDKTLPLISVSDGFAMLILDCNLYGSTIYVLDHLFRNKLISDGTVILFADFNVHAASPNHSSRRAWAEVIETFDISYSDEGNYNWGGRKFIVHGYTLPH